MVIYGTALLSVCLLAGLVVGDLLGRWLGLGTNVGGVGIAMLLLLFSTSHLRRIGKLPPATDHGVMYWNAIYIPVTVAMASVQDVRAAVTGGPVALLAGALAVAACCALVPVLTKLGRQTPAPAAE